MLGIVNHNAGLIYVPRESCRRWPIWVGACLDCGGPWTQTPNYIRCLDCQGLLWRVVAEAELWDFPHAEKLPDDGVHNGAFKVSSVRGRYRRLPPSAWKNLLELEPGWVMAEYKSESESGIESSRLIVLEPWGLKNVRDKANRQEAAPATPN